MKSSLCSVAPSTHFFLREKDYLQIKLQLDFEINSRHLASPSFGNGGSRITACENDLQNSHQQAPISFFLNSKWGKWCSFLSDIQGSKAHISPGDTIKVQRRRFAWKLRMYSVFHHEEVRGVGSIEEKWGVLTFGLV